jgi:hypothetical protein
MIMKKVYLSALALVCAVSGLNAQQTTREYHFGPIKETAKLSPNAVKPSNTAIDQTKALNILWTEDFSGGMGPLSTANGAYVGGGANGATYWTIGAGTHPLSSFGWTEQMDNEFLRWDSYNPNSAEPGGFASTQINGEIVSPTITYTGTTNSIGISFDTETMYCCNFNYAPFGISTSTDDGATWSDTVYFDFGVDRNEATEDIAHPLFVNQSLESIVPAGPQAQFKFKFIWDGNEADGNGQYNTHYFWLIDNVEIYEIPDTELALLNAWHGDILNDWEYSMTPLTQVREMVAGVVISNNGANQETVNISAQVVDVANGNIGMPIVQSHTIAVGDVDTVWFNTGFTPSANGEYRVDFSVPADDIPANDAISTSSLMVNDDLMAHDYGATSSYGWNPSSTNPNIVAYAQASHAWGQIYKPEVTQDVFGVDVYLGDATTTDLYLLVQIMQIDPNDVGEWIQDPLSLPLAQKDWTTAAGDIDAVTSVWFDTPATLEAGKSYIVEVLKVDGTSGTEAFFVGGSEGNNEDDDFSAVGYGDYGSTGGVTYYNGWNNAHYIRPNFRDVTGLNQGENTATVSVYPNPASTNVRIAYAVINTSEIAINVVDITGKTVFSSNEGTVEAGTHNLDLNTADFANGVYTIQIVHNNGIVTSKFIKK